MPSTDYDIRMLNDLIEATLDSADGYVEAAKDSSRFADMFAARSSGRRAAARSSRSMSPSSAELRPTTGRCWPRSPAFRQSATGAWWRRRRGC